MPNDEILRSWRTLDRKILSLSEQELWDLLKLEHSTARRRLFVARIFGRANKLRGTRELKEYLKGSA
jgi:hypothetical protein